MSEGTAGMKASGSDLEVVCAYVNRFSLSLVGGRDKQQSHE